MPGRTRASRKGYPAAEPRRLGPAPLALPRGSPLPSAPSPALLLFFLAPSQVHSLTAPSVNFLSESALWGP